MAVRHVRMGGTLLCLLFLVVLLREFRESSNCSFMHPERCTRLVISLHLTTSSAYYKLPFKLASRRFNGGRLLFTATGVGTFQAQRLLIYGDVSPNPGPRRKPTKYPYRKLRSIDPFLTLNFMLTGTSYFAVTGRKVVAVLPSLFAITSPQHVRKALQHQWNHSYSIYTSDKDALL